MRPNLKLLATAPALALLLGACSSQTTGPRPAAATGKQLPPASWKLHLKASCPTGTAPESCVGAYGFTLLESGRFEVGPGPHGETWGGQIEADELETVKGNLDTLIQDPAILSQQSVRCEDLQTEDSREEQLSFSRGGDPRELSRYQGKQFCAIGGKQGPASSLHQAVLVLAKRHYPTPFPSSCLERAQAVESLYGALTGCQKDADCTYLDNSYAPIPPQAVGYVALENCTWVPTLPVANAALVHDAQDRLVAGLQEARQVCGAQLTRVGCPGLRGFQSNSAPPVCDAGTCKVNPSVR